MPKTTHTVTLGLRPSDHKLSAAEFLALFAVEDRHPNALGYELKRTTVPVLQTLAYEGVAPDALAEAAYDELTRRALAARALSAAIGRDVMACSTQGSGWLTQARKAGKHP